LAFGVLFLRSQHIGFLGAGFVLGSALIHTGYFLLLQHSYRLGDLSLVYPLARGTGATLATLAAIVLLREHPSGLALLGALVVATSIFLFAEPDKGAHTRKGFLSGLGTGVLIALYTLWDKHAVSTLAISPLVMEWGTTLGLALLLAPAAARNWKEVQQEWKIHRRQAIGIGFLSPLSYILVLSALVFSPVSYIAPAREISILIGAVFGVRLLAEGHRARRCIAAAMMVCGIVALALG
jgi:drug/metabolite transporter (DMT)-like permease